MELTDVVVNRVSVIEYRYIYCSILSFFSSYVLEIHSELSEWIGKSSMANLQPFKSIVN